MRLAIINNTSYGTSGGHLKWLSNIVPALDKINEIESQLVISPNFYDFKFQNELSTKTKFKIFQPRSIFYGQKCSNELKLILDEFCPDIIILPNERLIKYNTIPSLIMVRNMEPLVQIENNPFREVVVNRIKKTITKRSCKSANHIIAVSNYVKKSIINDFNINSNKISVIYHGGAIREKTKNLIKAKSINIRDSKNFLFTAGSIRPARGLEDIIIAMGTLKKKYEALPDLVIAGECGQNMQKYKKSLIQLLRKYNLANTVQWAGKLNQMEMGWCYHNSLATIITSRVESFCLIAQEAMSYGAFIISANSKCLPEILDKAAIYYESKKVKELAKIIDNKVLHNSNSIKTIKNLAHIRSKKFTWHNETINLMRTLNKIIEN